MSSARNPRYEFAPARERGAVLVTSMLLLLVMTVLALGASQATRMQERMAGNARDHDLAFQSAEAGLRKAERLIDDPALTAPPWACSVGRCKVWERSLLPPDIAYRSPDEWWRDNAWAYSTDDQWSATPSKQIAGTGLAHRDPMFVIEEIEEVTDSQKLGPPQPSRVYYRITSTGEGGTKRAVVVLQSTFERRFN
jgi:type IV pilus assembly protein PilX